MRARGSLSAVYRMGHLKAACMPISCNIIADRTAAGGNAFFQDRLYGLLQPGAVCTAKPTGRLPRANPGTEKGFVRINITNAG